jgi:hypothetical protein
MQAIKAKPFQALEVTERKPLTKTAESKSDAVAAVAKKNAEKDAAKAAEKPAEQPPRPTTNNQGETIGSRLNVSA